jgi:hypothetical protein
MAKDEMAKLRILLDHWIEHNREHAQEFTEWAVKAKDLGDAGVHHDVAQAAEQMNKANEHLIAALKRLKEK